jgi:uncharacterized protein with HEPN domain
MSRPDDAARVQHMLQAARNALRLAQGRTRADLDSDLALALSLWKLLEIIGEAAARVTPGVRTANPHVPWQLAADTRNRLTHGYDTVDYSVVWSTVKNDLPSLVPSLEAVLLALEEDRASAEES